MPDDISANEHSEPRQLPSKPHGFPSFMPPHENREDLRAKSTRPIPFYHARTNVGQVDPTGTKARN